MIKCFSESFQTFKIDDDDGVDEWARDVSVLHNFYWEIEQDVNLRRCRWLPLSVHLLVLPLFYDCETG